MAITIISQPLAIVPSDNPITWVFESNQSTQANFRFRIITSFAVGASTAFTQISEDVVYAEVGGRAHFNASNYATTRAKIAAIQGGLYSTPLYRIQIQIIEEYGTPPTPQANVTSSKLCIKSRLSDRDWTALNIPTQFQKLRYLTNRPRNEFYSVPNMALPISMVINDSASVDLRGFMDGVQVGSTINVTQAYEVMHINTNVAFLAAQIGEPLDSFDTFTITYNNTPTPEVITINIYRGCGKYWVLRWVNEFGVYDWFVFNHNLEEMSDASEITYNKQFGNWEGNSFLYNIANSGINVVIIDQKDKGVVSSGWMEEETQNWLTEIYKSPKVDLINEDGDIFPIKLTKRSSTKKQTRFDDLVNEVIEFEYIGGHKSILL
jgi:hypothetical protein